MNMNNNELSINIVVGEGNTLFAEAHIVGDHEQVASALGDSLNANPDVKMVVMKSLLYALESSGQIDLDELEVLLEQATHMGADIMEVIANG